MAEGKQVESALLTEHFRYTPLTLLDEIINTVNELVYQAVSAVERGLLDAPPEALGFGRSENQEVNNHQRTPNDANSEGDDRNLNDENPVAVAAAAAAVEIENGVHQLETLLQATVDRNFDKLEIYVLRNVLSVPSDLVAWVRLKHYENLQFSSTSSLASSSEQGADDPEEITPESLLHFRRKVQQSQKLNASLRAETRRNDAILAKLRGLLGISAPIPASLKTENDGLISASSGDSAMPVANVVAKASESQLDFSFLTNAPAAPKLGLPSSLNPNVKSASSTDQPVKSTTAYALSQLPALKGSLEQLKPEIQALKDLVGSLEGQKQQLQGQGYVGNGEGNEMATKKLTAADERAVYIETQARLHLERRGVDVDGGNSSRDDVDDIGTGRKKIPPDEVHSLERIAAALGGTARVGEENSG